MKNIKVSFFRTSKGFINSGIVHISSSVDEMLVLKFYFSETEGLCINLWGKIIKPECPPSNEFPSRLTRLNLPEWLRGTTVGENEIEIDPIVFSHWVFHEVCPKWEDLFLKKAETAMQNSCFDDANLTLQKDNFLEYFWGNYRASVRTSSLLAWVSDEVLCMDRGEFWKKLQ